MITIINYGMGNIGSLKNMIKRANGKSKVSSDLHEISGAEKLILPGVGSFDNGMKKLRDSGIAEIVTKKATIEKTPILCICLGMQLLTETSMEGVLPGLGLISGKTVRFRFDGSQHLKIPHMGWNSITVLKQSPLFHDMYEDASFYFVHSYYVVCNNDADILTTTKYGSDFVSSLQRENIYATQFHPEKSHKYGLKLVENFVKLT